MDLNFAYYGATIDGANKILTIQQGIQTFHRVQKDLGLPINCKRAGLLIRIVCIYTLKGTVTTKIRVIIP
jgi:hypothetical protein